ncbi:MAG: DUF998 domain-containing protein [Cellvibrionaceae bacterium]
MRDTISSYLNITGLIIPFWLILGVIITSNFYPGYSHFHYAMSQLGASGSPTEFFSRFINNYPLGVLFIAFGIGVIKTLSESRLSEFSGFLLIAHGIGSIGAGYFPCDAGCNPSDPSFNQNMHNLFGLIMALSLLIANAIWIYLSHRLLNKKWFTLFSLACCFIAIAALPAMGMAIEKGEGFGLYQRINYGISVIWVSVLAFILLKRS